MGVRVRIPGPLRRLADGNAEVIVEGSTVAEVIDALDKKYPGFKQRLCDEQGNLRQFINIYHNDMDIRFAEGLATKVADNDDISIIPAVAGGIYGEKTA